MWKDICGYEGLYKISDSGEVKSLQRHVENGSKNGMILKERILSKCECKNGYYYVSLRDGHRRKNFYIHKLVANAFLDELGDTVNHKDGNKKNNCVSNLEIVSYSENNKHAYDIGLRKKGENHYNAKLTYAQVEEIKHRGKYAPYYKIGKKYGVSAATIRDILLKNTWK
jgi:hypothetical protein